MNSVHSLVSGSSSSSKIDSKEEGSVKKELSINIPKRLSLALETRELSSPRTPPDSFRNCLPLHSFDQSLSGRDSPQSSPVTRVPAQDVERLGAQIQGYLEKEVPPCIFHVVGQLVYGQYALLSSEAYELLAIGLKKENLLIPFFSVIADLLIPAQERPLSQQQCRLLLKGALIMMQSPCIESFTNEPELEKVMKEIFSLASLHFPSPRLNSLEGPADPKESKSISLPLVSFDIHESPRVIFSSTSEEEGSTDTTPTSADRMERTFRISPFVKTNRGQYSAGISELLLDVEDTMLFYRENSDSLKDLTEKAEAFLFSQLHDSEDLKIFKKLQSISPNLDLAQQKSLLLSVETFVCQRKHIFRNTPQEKNQLLEMTLRILTHPKIRPLIEKMKIKNACENILKIVASDSKRVKRLKQIVSAHLNLPPLSLSELQFLLLWLQINVVKTESTLKLMAGTRVWDPEGHLYQLAAAQFLEIAKMEKPDLDLLARWIHFLDCWREVPTNQDLIFKTSFYLPWRKAIAALAGLPKLKGMLGQDFLVEFCHELKALEKNLEKTPDMEDLALKESTEELSALDFLIDKSTSPISLAASPPKKYDLLKMPKLNLSFPSRPEKSGSSKEQLWSYDEKWVQTIRDTFVYFLLDIHEKLETPDIVSGSTSHQTKLVLKAAAKFDQISNFVKKELLFSSSIEEIQQKTKIFCLVQGKLIDSFAFDAACALHAAFDDQCISRLDPILEKVKGFHQTYRNAEAICAQKDRGKQLRHEYLENQKALIPLSHFFGIFTRLRENSSFTKQGIIDCGLLKEFGSTLQIFQSRKKTLKIFWEEDLKIFYHPSLLQTLAEEPARLSEEQQKSLDDRSRENHPSKSTIFWGVDIAKK